MALRRGISATFFMDGPMIRRFKSSLLLQNFLEIRSKRYVPNRFFLSTAVYSLRPIYSHKISEKSSSRSGTVTNYNRLAEIIDKDRYRSPIYDKRIEWIV